MHGEGELYHYGRLGMKWGQHRFKDRYGGLNNAGRARVKVLVSEHKKLSAINTPTKKGTKKLSDVEKEYEHLTGKQIGPQDSPKIHETRKRVQDMTNEELTAYNTRKQLETTYQNYQPKPEPSKGKKFVKAVIGTPVQKVLLPVAIDVGKKYITSKAMVKLNLKEEKKKD